MVVPPAAAAASRAGSLRRAGKDLVVGLGLLLAAAVLTWRLFGLEARYLLHTAALYGVMAGLIVWRPPPDLPGATGLGSANRVTLGRSVLVLSVSALVLQPEVLRDAGYWWIIVVSTIAMVLDGVDGRIARKTDTHTAFGARFDMELDAFLLLVLSVLVWLSGKVGPWVILIGALRYLFVAASWGWRPLRAELPNSQRRKVVCVVQGVVLLVCLGPIIPAPIATVVAAGALAMLIYSFGVDVRWAARQAILGG